MDLENIQRLRKDLKQASATLSEQEARFLVDAYYLFQEDRKRAHNQVRALGENAEPHSVIQWLADQSRLLEGEIKKVLDTYAASKMVGQWMMAQHGIGPVIAAGMLAHIDIKKAPTAGHIWRYAGLDPTLVWGKGQKRPWNADLKVLCWKAGQSFMKFSSSKSCFYGKLYRERKAYETQRNDSMANAALAAEYLTTKKFRDTTEAVKHLKAGKLPPAQIDGRARRYAVKMFLSHLQTAWWFAEFNKLPPAPYAMVHMGHAHVIEPPHADVVPGLEEALRGR
jgi:hypothetical protein